MGNTKKLGIVKVREVAVCSKTGVLSNTGFEVTASDCGNKWLLDVHKEKFRTYGVLSGFLTA